MKIRTKINEHGFLETKFPSLLEIGSLAHGSYCYCVHPKRSKDRGRILCVVHRDTKETHIIPIKIKEGRPCLLNKVKVHHEVLVIHVPEGILEEIIQGVSPLAG